jgi:hypothetical protein
MTALDNFIDAVQARLDRALAKEAKLARDLSVTRATLRHWLEKDKPLRRLPDAEKRLRVLEPLGMIEHDLLLNEDDFKARLALNRPHHIPSQEIRLWNANESAYEGYVLDLMKTARQAQLAVFCPQFDLYPANKKNRPRELSSKDFRLRLKDDVIYQSVEIFYSIEPFIKSLQDAYEFKRGNYQTRYFLKPPKPIPSVNLRIVDQTQYFFESFSVGEDENYDEKVWQVDYRHPIASMLSEYWRYIWHKSIPFSASIETAAKEILGSLGVEAVRAVDIVERTKDSKYPEIVSLD